MVNPWDSSAVSALQTTYKYQVPRTYYVAYICTFALLLQSSTSVPLKTQTNKPEVQTAADALSIRVSHVAPEKTQG